MESGVHATVPLRGGKKMRKRRELDALVGGVGSRGGRLLSASSDEGEPWGRRTSRRRRSRPFVRLAAALALCVCVVSAATVLWLFVDVRKQIVSLRVEMDRVSTIGGNVNDDLQLCHTSFKELKKNASALQERLEKLEIAHQALTMQMNKTASELMSVSEQLSAAPKLVDTPRRIAELQRTVADFGSQIKGFDSSISSAHKQALTATSGVEELKSYLVHLDERTNDTIANVSANVKLDESLKEQIAILNTTLMSRLDGLQSIIDEINKPKEVSASPTAPPSAVPFTSITTIAGPVKPRVLEMKEPASS
ncbi:EF-hand calcium-binding domain-containing protein 14 isoform X1 [Pieris brassicae]|uniref:Uncharacterized protein n=1 Tax=Pieris brassicae TaxID=7116 RepID=A0A9P0TL92_PIEBR|nr:EF-hand calcium-binding domain-containing protein 14 isoform X1 [Pieris brassicae]XP_045522237.1 EF-hand calcium-binding domain-containing protein 14 isoform X1 [Pieris brassicae]CAH4030547.1 unnamed protein product [Pieris brassicae]